MPTFNKMKQQAILNAALELFAERGFHDAPMARVASQAKVGVGSIYRYFTDKPGLIDELYQQVDESLQQAIVQGVNQELSTRKQFLQLIVNLTNFLANHPQEFKFLEQYYHSPFGIDKKREKWLLESKSGHKNHFMELFFKGKDAAVKPLPVPVLLSLSFGPVLFLVRDVIAGLVELDETLIAQVAEGCWEAISDKIKV